MTDYTDHNTDPATLAAAVRARRFGMTTDRRSLPTTEVEPETAKGDGDPRRPTPEQTGAGATDYKPGEFGEPSPAELAAAVRRREW